MHHEAWFDAQLMALPDEVQEKWRNTKKEDTAGEEELLSMASTLFSI